MDWLPLHSGHPLMVHLPLVALPVAVVLDLLAVWRQEAHWRRLASILWVLGLLGAAAAVATGLIAYDRVDHSDLAHDVMTLHRNVALAAAGLFLLGGIVRWRWSYSRPVALFGALVGVLGITGLIGAGYLGGEIVFRHGIGLSTGVLEQVVRERGGHAHDGIPEPHDEETETADSVHHHDPGDPTPHTH